MPALCWAHRHRNPNLITPTLTWRERLEKIVADNSHSQQLAAIKELRSIEREEAEERARRGDDERTKDVNLLAMLATEEEQLELRNRLAHFWDLRVEIALRHPAAGWSSNTLLEVDLRTPPPAPPPDVYQLNPNMIPPAEDPDEEDEEETDEEDEEESDEESNEPLDENGLRESDYINLYDLPSAAESDESD